MTKRTFPNTASVEPDPRYVNVTNGVLDLHTDPVTLLPHSEDFHFIQSIPVCYDPNAKCPAIQKFLEEVQPNETDRKTLIEWAGYCLYRDYPFHKALILTGNGRNGISTYLHLLCTFLGTANITSQDPHTLKTKCFAIAELYGRLANICPDLSGKSSIFAHICQGLPDATSIYFRMATDNDILVAERRRVLPFTFRNYAKLTCSCNQIPSPIAENDADAFLNRCAIISFPSKFEGPKQDLALLNKLTTPAELSGLLNFAVKALKDLLAKGSFCKR